MNIQLLGWKTTGLRCPDTEIQFNPSTAESSISLVQMPNGTGKSTIIELIEAAMTGSASGWPPSYVMEFINTDNPSDFGTFELHFNLSNVDQKSRKVSFQIDFDFVVGTVTYSTLENVNVGLVDGWEPPSELIPFLKDDCVQVFVFKGDKVEHLLDKNRADAEMSIKAFFGLSNIDELCDHIETEFQKVNSGIKTEQGHSKKENQLNDWILHRRLLKDREKTLEHELKPLRSRYDESHLKVQKLMSGQSVNNEKKEKYETELNNYKNNLDKATRYAFDSLRNPLFISNKITSRLNELHNNLEKFKLPGTSSVFFDELCNADNCICDRIMDEKSISAIKKNSAGFLSDNQINIVNGIKGDIIEFTNLADETKNKNIFDELNAMIKNYNSINNTYTAHITKMKEEATEKHRILMEEYEYLVVDIQKKEGMLKVLNNQEGSYKEAKKKRPKDCNQIPIVDKVIESLEEEIALANDTLKELNAKNKLINVLKQSSKIALSDLKIEIGKKCNEKLKAIIPEGDWLEVKEVDKNIKIGYGDRTQSRGSGGQNVAVAYSFATSLLERSGAEFPLIVDHPVTALMDSARRELGKKLANICHQFIGFIIDTEKSGFVESLSTNSKNIKYITMFKKISANEIYMSNLPKDTSKVYKSENGIVCTDKDFFDNFEDVNEYEED